ncbi:MAG: heme exporter protein CcmB [Pseudomonadota bacterium]
MAVVFNKHLFLHAGVNLGYELLSVCRCYQDIIYPLLFLIMAMVLFPLSSNADPSSIEKIAAGIFWVIVLFLLVLTLEQLFREDWQEGELEQLVLNPTNLLQALFIKLFVFCLMISVPLTVMAPILSVALYIPIVALKTLVVSLWLGIPTLVFLGGIARVLTLGLRHSSLLIVLLVLPFYIPVLIFASSAVTFASIGLAANASLAWLGVLLLLSVSFSPFVISVVLRLGISNT